MAKIPRISRAHRSAPVPGVVDTGDGLGSVARALGAVADTGYAIAADREKREGAAAQKAYKKIQGERQVIFDNIEASKHDIEFDSRANNSLKQHQEHFAENPAAAEESYRKDLEMHRKQVGESASNTNVGGKLSRTISTRIEMKMREMQGWVSGRQSQKAKNELSIAVNEVVSQAEGIRDIRFLDDHLDVAEVTLRENLKAVHGADSEKIITKMRSDAAEVYAVEMSDSNPLKVSQELDARTGVFKDIDSDLRKSLQKKAQDGYEGLAKTRKFELVKANIDNIRELVDLYDNDDLKAADVWQKKDALTEQIKAVQIDPLLKPAERAELVSNLKDQIKAVDALDDIRRRQLPYDTEDNPGVVATLLQHQSELFKKNKGRMGKDLIAWQQQYRRLMLAFSDKQIGRGTFNTMYKQMSLALPKSLKQETNNTWSMEWSFDWRSPRQAGNLIINQRLATGRYANLSEQQKTDIRLDYAKRQNEADTKGVEITDDSAREMALKSLALNSGVVQPTPNLGGR